MSIVVYNTKSQKKEEYIPIESGKASIYVCGVTPYNHPHIGNARPFVTWDVIHRYLDFKGYEVKHIQNFTDVDDKIINSAEKRGITWKELSEEFIAAYYESMDQLNVRRVQEYPKVSDHMQEIIQMVENLIVKGYAYEVDGDVYFSVESFERYGELSHRTLEDMEAGARVEVDERKGNPMDFALWKSAKPGEPSWESPWGKGRPGWHIECSAMSIKYLGDQFDFHGGGSDLIFPHHENEIAQTESCTGKHPYVKYWLHNGFITVNQEKMSKSLDNFFLVKDILELYSGEVTRFFLLSSHYRSPLNFSDEQMNEAKKGWDRLNKINQVLAGWEAKKSDMKEKADGSEFIEKMNQAFSEFDNAMADDFNTALALASLYGISKEINQKASLGNVSQEELAVAKDVWGKMICVLGLFEAAEVVQEEVNTSEKELMALLIEIREEARKEKNWALADRIRNDLLESGIQLIDSTEGVQWKRSEF
ncbi:MAG: cysteine--tRNA ligase [Negativicutes bacterium]|nr:cysteine--tRNA ligase [Negativicutes bacterium]